MPTQEPDLAAAMLHLNIASAEADLGIKNDQELFEVSKALGLDLSNNANPFVPWDDPQIPFECDCGAVIYSDSVHEH